MEWLELLLFFLLITFLAKYVGIYLYKVLHPEEKTGLEFVFGPIENFIYKFAKIKRSEEHNWKEYLLRLACFSFISLVFIFGILSLQAYLPLNPEKVKGLPADLIFNIGIGFMVNADWQSYLPERTLSYFSQMAGLTVQNFLSPAIGLCTAATLVRALSGSERKTLGNFWIDLTRISCYLFLPLSLLLALVFIALGSPQNFDPYVTAYTLDGGVQTIAGGPVASQEAIKILGTNGGGFMNTNSAHPYENPNFISNFLQMLFLLIIPAGQTYYFGKSIRNQKHGWCLYAAMSLLLIAGVIFLLSVEKSVNPLLSTLNIDPSLGNMEGKEMRFGTFNSALYTALTTAVSNGSVNSSIDSYLPLGGFVALLNMQLGETIFGGVGSGLYSIVMLVILAVYLAGLIIGRAPDYLGKKIETFDIKMTMLTLFLFIFSILGFTAWGATSSWGKEALANGGSHGFTEILYSFSSAIGNNGSSMLGPHANTPAYNAAIGFAMLIGRFLMITPVLALAGSLGSKITHPPTKASLSVSSPIFVLFLIGLLLILGALSYLPSLMMGPILENFLIKQGHFF